MSTSKKTSSSRNTVILWLFAAALIANLAFAVVTNARVNRLHRFYNTFSAEYRTLGNAEPNVPTSPIAAPLPGNAPSDTLNCVNTDIDTMSDPSIGDPDAPVVIVEYSDFECSFCAQFVIGAYSQIKSTYIDSGIARIVFKDFPLDNYHPLAIPAAVAANCVAQELGDAAFFAYHDRLFFQQSELSESSIINWAREAGLSDEQINACIADPSMEDEILADRSEGSRAGIDGTPSFVINGELIVGAQPYAVFEQSIERALERAQTNRSCGS